MRTQESFYRPDPLAREARMLGGPLYNDLIRALRRAPDGHVFVPLRAMQYLAVIDSEEVVFVDGMGPRIIELAWQRFRPQARSGLLDPVPFEAVYYHAKAAALMPRLLSELGRTMHTQRAKRAGATRAPVVPLRRV